MQTLTGDWRIALDPYDRGREERWFDQIRPAAVSGQEHGGILYPVALEVLPAIDLARLVLRPDPTTSTITVTAAVRNSDGAAAMRLHLGLAQSAGEGRGLAATVFDQVAAPGRSRANLRHQQANVASPPPTSNAVRKKHEHLDNVDSVEPAIPHRRLLRRHGWQ